jgi:hypothetical protein
VLTRFGEWTRSVVGNADICGTVAVDRLDTAHEQLTIAGLTRGMLMRAQRLGSDRLQVDSDLDRMSEEVLMER